MCILSSDNGQYGLAAAAVRKPTVAFYPQYFRYLWVVEFAEECGLYGEAPRHEMITMLGNFPEKGGSMRERRVRKPLKRHDFSSASFPKRLLLGRVGYSSCSLSIAALTVGFGCATKRTVACRCKCDWKSVDPTHSIPSLGLMPVTAWVKRRQGGCRP